MSFFRYETGKEKEGFERSAVYIIVAITAVGGLFLLSNLFGNLVYVLLMKVFKVPMNILAAYSWIAELVVAALLISVFFGISKAVFVREDKALRSHALPDREVCESMGVTGTPGIETGKAGFSGKLSLISMILGAGVSGLSYLWVTLAAYIPYFEKSLRKMDADNATMSAAGGGMLYLFLSAAVVAPILEEVIFRGLVYRSLNKIKAGWFSVLVSAVVFGVYHMNAAQAVFATGLGIVAAIVYAKTGNLLYPILVHMTNNLIGVIQSGIPESAVFATNIFTILMAVPTVYILYRCVKGKAQSDVISLKEASK